MWMDKKDVWVKCHKKSLGRKEEEGGKPEFQEPHAWENKHERQCDLDGTQN